MNTGKSLSGIMLAIFIGGISIETRAGTAVSGGGRAVVCRDENKVIKSARLLDLYEGEIFGLKMEAQRATYEEQIESISLKVNQSRHNFTLNLERANKEFIEKILFIDENTVLTPVEDSFEPVAPKDCGIEQVANFHQTGRILIKAEIWDKFSVLDRAALTVHEIAYKEAREVGRPRSSYFVRRFVSFLFSTTPLKPIEKVAKFDVGYSCNHEALLGLGVLYRLRAYGNYCGDGTSRLCDTKIHFDNIFGQIVYDRAQLHPQSSYAFVNGLNPDFAIPHDSSTFAPIESQIFEGVDFSYSIKEINGTRVPKVFFPGAGEDETIELKCHKLFSSP